MGGWESLKIHLSPRFNLVCSIDLYLFHLGSISSCNVLPQTTLGVTDWKSCLSFTGWNIRYQIFQMWLISKNGFAASCAFSAVKSYAWKTPHKYSHSNGNIISCLKRARQSNIRKYDNLHTVCIFDRILLTKLCLKKQVKPWSKGARNESTHSTESLYLLWTTSDCMWRRILLKWACTEKSPCTSVANESITRCRGQNDAPGVTSCDILWQLWCHFLL